MRKNGGNEEARRAEAQHQIEEMVTHSANTGDRLTLEGLVAHFVGNQICTERWVYKVVEDRNLQRWLARTGKSPQQASLVADVDTALVAPAPPEAGVLEAGFEFLEFFNGNATAFRAPHANPLEDEVLLDHVVACFEQPAGIFDSLRAAEKSLVAVWQEDDMTADEKAALQYALIHVVTAQLNVEGSRYSTGYRSYCQQEAATFSPGDRGLIVGGAVLELAEEAIHNAAANGTDVPNLARKFYSTHCDVPAIVARDLTGFTASKVEAVIRARKLVEGRNMNPDDASAVTSAMHDANKNWEAQMNTPARADAFRDEVAEIIKALDARGIGTAAVREAAANAANGVDPYTGDVLVNSVEAPALTGGSSQNVTTGGFLQVLNTTRPEVVINENTKAHKAIAHIVHAVNAGIELHDVFEAGTWRIVDEARLTKVVVGQMQSLAMPISGKGNQHTNGTATYADARHRDSNTRAAKGWVADLAEVLGAA